MSLKHVELQIAIPRTQEMGKWQHEIQQRAQLAQDQIAASLQGEMLQNQNRVTSRNTKLKTGKDSQESKNGTYKEKSDSKRKQKPIKVKHPHKGCTIDYSG